MMQPECPPGFVVRTEAHKAAANNGFRLERGIEGGWLHFGSTTAQGDIWIAGVSPNGPWLLSVSRSEIAAEIGVAPVPAQPGPGVASFVFASLGQLYVALDRTYRLGVSLPDAPLVSFRAATKELPRTTEAERLVVQRVGQDVFRKALIAYWGGKCPLTGITDPALLRASHIVPWAECATDEQRLDVHNGLLLSALWDAAFDAGLVSFAEDGIALISSTLGTAAADALGVGEPPRLFELTAAHKANLEWHRAKSGFYDQSP